MANRESRFIAQLAFYRLHAGFPEHRNDLAPIVIAHLAEQLGVGAVTLDEYDWNGRTERRHRDAILEFLGVRPFDDAAEEAFRTWLMTNALPKAPNVDTLDEWITTWLLQSKIDLDRLRPERVDSQIRGPAVSARSRC